MKQIRLVAAITVLLILAAACGRSAGTGASESLTGTINADGSSTVFPVTQAIAEEWQAEAPNVNVSVGTSGTGGGFQKFCAGETDISDASRPIKEEEAAICQQNGVEYVELTVAIDGLSVLVNPENDFVSCLTVDELKKVWEPNSSVKNWMDIRAGFPDRPLALYGPGTDSGTFDYFTGEIVGEEGASRSDYTASEDDNVLVRGIAGDENALGYFGFAYYEQNQDKLKVVEVDGGEGCIEPTRSTIESGEYAPLSRPLFIYVSKESAGREEVAAFVDFYLETMNDILADVGYIEVPEELLTEQQAKWEEFSG